METLFILFSYYFIGVIVFFSFIGIHNSFCNDDDRIHIYCSSYSWLGVLLTVLVLMSILWDFLEPFITSDKVKYFRFFNKNKK